MLFGSRLNKLATSIRRALSEYAVLGINPPFVADFIEKKYLTGGASSTFSNAITHARAGNATMTDGYGPELVTNGGFDSDLSGWTDTNSHWSVVDGRAYHASSSAYNPLSLTLSLSGTYILTFDAEVISASNTAHLLVDGTSTQLLANGSDSYSVFITDATTIVFSREPGSTAEFYIDNVSVREMPVIKWGPHNVVTFSEEFDNANWTKTGTSISENTAVAPNSTQTADKLVEGTSSGNKYTSGSGSAFAVTAGMKVTVSCFIKAGERTWCALGISKTSGQPYTGGAFTDRSAYFNLSTGAAGTVGSSLSSSSITDVGNGWYLCSITGTAVASGSIAPFITIALGDVNASYTGDGSSGIYLWGAHLYRSDLGGMVDNPERGDSYVPTTSAARFLPRVGHHVFNGDAWVNEGVLAESEQRVNLYEYSSDFTNSYWAKENVPSGGLNFDGVGPDGQEDSAVKLIDSNAGGTGSVYLTSGVVTVGVSSQYTASVFAKKLGVSYLGISTRGFTTPANATTFFDLDDGIVSQKSSEHDVATIQNVGNGWYRCAITFTTDATDTTGQNRFFLSDNGTSTTVNLDGTSSILLYGAQFDVGNSNASAPTPSSYIPTSGQQEIREAESFTIPSANLPWPPEVLSGVEEVTSGTFDTAAALDDFGTSGTVTYDTATQSARLQPNSQLTQFLDGTDNVAGSYKISWNQTLVSGTRTRLLARNHPNTLYISTAYFNGSGEKSIVVTTTDGVMFRINSDSSEALIDNISVQKVEDKAVSIATEGRMTYADEDALGVITFWDWKLSNSDNLSTNFDTRGSDTGQPYITMKTNNNGNIIVGPSQAYAPDIFVPFNISARYGSTFINGGVDGSLMNTAINHTDGLPDLSSTDLNLAYDYMGTISEFRVWDKDLGDAGIVEATNPSLEPSLSLTFEGVGTNSFTVSDWSE
jgi:hypothetical protein